MARQRGENAEIWVTRVLKANGWVAGRIRQGPIDVVAAKDGRTLLVQVKSGGARAKGTELDQMIQWARAFNADTEVWYLKGRGKVVKRRIFAAKRMTTT